MNKFIEDGEVKNIQASLDKCKKILNDWLQRDLTVFSRTLLTQTELFSRLTDPAFSFAFPSRVVKEIHKTKCNCIWKNKHHNIINEF